MFYASYASLHFSDEFERFVSKLVEEFKRMFDDVAMCFRTICVDGDSGAFISALPSRGHTRKTSEPIRTDQKLQIKGLYFSCV